MAYIETPRTDAGNFTFLTNGHKPEDFSVENTLLSPLKRKGNNDILAQMRRGRGVNLKTPGARLPLADRNNNQSNPAKQEFTPLLQSVAKKNLQRSAKLKHGPDTPAFLKGSLQGSDSPALPVLDTSTLYASHFGSSVVLEDGDTPVPQVATSSSQSTPLVALPKRDAAGIVNEQGNLMTLREQENIINRIEKENFGLKLKIHFLEESLRKTGPGFNEAALKENTDLKVDRVTLQKELGRCKKMLGQAERDVEALRRHVEEVQERAKHKQADVKIRQELESLQSELKFKETQIIEMRDRVDSTETRSAEVDKLKAELEDLEVDLREKDRLIDEKDDEIEDLKSRAKTESEELEDELEEARKRIEELEEQEDVALRATEELQNAKEAEDKAQADLEELQEELANKSMTSKGLGRQLEEKASKLQNDLTELRRSHATLQHDYDDKAREVRKLQDAKEESEQEADIQTQKLKDQNELLHGENDSVKRKCDSLITQIASLSEDLRAKTEDKDLLHTRHDALTVESQQLQKDLHKSRLAAVDLEQILDIERQQAEATYRRTRAEAKENTDSLSDELGKVRRELMDLSNKAAAEKDLWEVEKRDIESQQRRALEQAAGLQRTINTLQENKDSEFRQDKEAQQALENEKLRHENEEKILEEQIRTMNADLENKRLKIEQLRQELADKEEELKGQYRQHIGWEEKVQALEDEIEVLQASLDEEVESAQNEINAMREERDEIKAQFDSMEAAPKARNLEDRLEKLQVEKQTLQDRLATRNLESHRMETSLAEIAAERDELQSQMKHLQGQLDDTFKLDQDKLELRSSKLRLENELGRLRRERQSVTEKNQNLEGLLEEEIKKSSANKGRLEHRIQELEGEIASSSSEKQHRVDMSQKETERLEKQIVDLQRQLSKTELEAGNTEQQKLLQKDLILARQKESGFLRREATQNANIQDLKRDVGRLERELNDADIARLTFNSPKSADSSARRSEVVELRRQLTESMHKIKEVRNESKMDLQDLQRHLDESNSQVKKLDEAREELEAELASAQQIQESLRAQNATSNSTVSRLRARLASLEQDLRSRHRQIPKDETMAEERKDLHDLLKEAKLEAEDLRLQISSKETSMNKLASREKDVRSHIKRIREERNSQEQKSRTLTSELDQLRMRHQKALDKLSRQQQVWKEERLAMASRVRFPHNSISELQDGQKPVQQDLLGVEKRHESELRGLGKQIKWLKAKFEREEGFRAALVYEKQFLMMRVGMFEACNATDLELLGEMGVKPPKKPSQSTRLRIGQAAIEESASRSHRAKAPSLRAVVLAIIAQARMKRMAGQWTQQRRIREALDDKLEAVRTNRKRPYNQH